MEQKRVAEFCAETKRGRLMPSERCCADFDAWLRHWVRREIVTSEDKRRAERSAELLAAAIKVNAMNIQSDAHKELRAAIAKATQHGA